MSAGLTDSDTMFSVRETPWHGLGAVLEEPPATVAEAIEASGLGWSVAKEPIAVDRGEASAAEWWVPRCEEIPGFYATVRQDTREVLGIVGERYRLVEYSQVAPAHPSTASPSCSCAATHRATRPARSGPP